MSTSTPCNCHSSKPYKQRLKRALSALRKWKKLALASQERTQSEEQQAILNLFCQKDPVWVNSYNFEKYIKELEKKNQSEPIYPIGETTYNQLKKVMGNNMPKNIVPHKYFKNGKVKTLNYKKGV